MSTSFDRVGAVLTAAAVGAVLSAPYAVKLLTGGINQCLVVGEDSRRWNSMVEARAKRIMQ